MDVYNIIFAIFLCIFCIIRFPAVRGYQKFEVVLSKNTYLDRFLVFLNWLGMLVFPLLCICTHIFDHWSMSIPGIIRFIGACIYTGGLVLMWWVVRALGKNWSMFLEIRREQELIITGPYALVRHPMYLAFYFLVFGQWLMTANWFIGIFGVASWCLLYFARIDHEERMMVQQFGEWYSRYIRVTNRLWPLRCQKRLTQ